ncbi:MAG: class I SAM-dependent methyltransferase [Treponema sp.]|jgi:SAM-dependent methyltransferase|nr:class I SAM-dependent methyltransferase [Treponema sp.]
MVSREFSIFVNWILDNLIPPVLRDCKWFMKPVTTMAYGREAETIMGFKEAMPFLSEEEIADYYKRTVNAPIARRPIDANKRSVKYILNCIEPDKDGRGRILDAACGRGYLLKKIMEKYPYTECTGVDYDTSERKFTTVKADLIQLPFENRFFDTVVCTHALEHIKKGHQALSELLRVTKKRFIKADEPLIKANEPLIKANEPLIKANKPLIKANEPLIKANEPLIKANEPLIKANEPLIKANERFIKANKPLIKANKPLIKADERFIKANEPLIKANEPLIKANEPLIKANERMIKANERLIITVPGQRAYTYTMDMHGDFLCSISLPPPLLSKNIGKENNVCNVFLTDKTGGCAV